MKWNLRLAAANRSIWKASELQRRLAERNNCSALASYYRRKNGAAPSPRWQHPALGSGNPAVRAAAARTRELDETRGWPSSTIRCALTA
jgi:hypothetical protein